MSRRIVVITDFDPSGSGYKNICVPLLTGLVNLGHEVKIAGLSYGGQEHEFPFSVIPAGTIQEAHMVANNLCLLWNPDIVLVALDIPLQQFFHENLRTALKRTPTEVAEGKTTDRKYIAITPLENPPLTFSWAAVLMNMDSVFFISELGKQEAIKAGISSAEHLVVGVDTVSWHPATPEEKKTLRKGLGIGEDEFVVLTVADNQERKNLWAGMEAISRLKKEVDRKVRYILVTRVDSPVGWKLNDLAIKMDITKELMTFKRGLPQKDLWALYAVADVYLQPSKAEGLGMPVLEAMACGIPCVATDTGALHELLSNEQGYLVQSEYTFTDVWGNSIRDMISISKASNCLFNIYLRDGKLLVTTEKALEYVRHRTWDIPVAQIDAKIQELLDVPQAQ